ncbi:MAG: peptide chain release factor 2 [bacterium]
MLAANDLKEFFASSEQLIQSLNLSDLNLQIEEIKTQLNQQNIWSDPAKASTLNQNLSKLNQQKTKIDQFEDLLENLQIAFDLEDEGQFEEIYSQVEKLKTTLENEKFLNGKFDDNTALLTVHSGAGGVDAEDWAAMLTSMYQSFCRKQNFDCTLIYLSVGDEGGVKTATMSIKGPKAYGLVKEEAGVHRLVRISPFNSGKTRETSFALVEVIPDNIYDKIGGPKIEEKDLKWDYFMAGGKGGQSVNTTYSAVRVTHIPTNTVVVCQNERSQMQNKDQALKYLANKLAILEAKKNKELEKELRGEFQSAEWGSQIRNYVLHPYKLVKDTRSGWETTDTDKVLLEGDLIDLIWSVKRVRHEDV